MATAAAARSFARNSLRTSTSAFQTATRASSSRFAPVARQAFRQQSRRGYASEASPKSGSNAWIYGLVGAGAVGGGAYYLYTQNASTVEKGPFVPQFEDYQKVYNAIAKKLEDEDDYDDGSYGPVLLRLAWHASGTYDAETKTGGSNGATMRFAPEKDHGANAGLAAARDFLEPIKEQFPWISYSDLWILAGVCAIQEMQGPTIPFRPGRADRDVSFCTPDGRLPDASKDQNHIRAIFGRMGFNDQEMVALCGAHALGRCHTDRSGYDGPWTFSPTVLTNDYFRLLLEEKWQWKRWNGPKQYEDKKTKSLMMLPTDMALVQDKKFRSVVEKYANDNEAFFQDFSKAVTKLFELGVPFTTSEEERMRFKTLAEQNP
ncbi:cytochrome c peroxidase, mitochondrial [Verruconis gallopava]|uniref:Peroxidase n=1 Tax=Verruconis gallopava TaxID=253628 RepID=A0A0D2AF86_9PEZI|nr:cytochrome c peroxidase, mitochondrial [Verruconis gallopava]KIW05140.1 cytochrome c peroxidase, mitochondrial [Verruconis gallopava]